MSSLSIFFIFKNSDTDALMIMKVIFMELEHGRTLLIWVLLFCSQWRVSSFTPTCDKFQGLWPNRQKARKHVEEGLFLSVILSKQQQQEKKNTFCWKYFLNDFHLRNFWTCYSHYENSLCTGDLARKKIFSEFWLKMFINWWHQLIIVNAYSLPKAKLERKLLNSLT